MYKGSKLVNDASPYVAEYNVRKRLATLGFTSPLKDLPSWKADIFVTIDAEIQKLDSKKAKKRGKR